MNIEIKLLEEETNGLWKGWCVSIGDKYADGLGYEEMLGLVAALTMPESRPVLNWMRTEEGHAAFRKGWSVPETILIEGDYESRKVKIDGQPLSADSSLALVRHSPDGFNWGYNGSGPAQLALAILLKYLTPEEALSLYQEFKRVTVVNWPQADIQVELPLKSILKEMRDSKIKQ